MAKVAPAFLQTKAIERIVAAFVWEVDNLARAFGETVAGFGPHNVAISEMALANAIHEANKDLSFLTERRGLDPESKDFDGLTVGKVAGMVAFRLCRGHLIHLNGSITLTGPDGELVEVKAYDLELIAGNLQTLAVMRLVTTHLLQLTVEDGQLTSVKSDGTAVAWFLKELLFLLTKRHYNQESLALLFDVLKAYAAPLAPVPEGLSAKEEAEARGAAASGMRRNSSASTKNTARRRISERAKS